MRTVDEASKLGVSDDFRINSEVTCFLSVWHPPQGGYYRLLWGTWEPVVQMLREKAQLEAS